MKFGKKSLIYSSVSLSFILYLFSADYIFNVLIKTDEEARLTEISLPQETKNIKFAFDEAKQVKLKWKDAFLIKGWVFNEDVKEKNRNVYLVLKGNNNTLTFEIEKDSLSRDDVTRAFHLGNIQGLGFELIFATYQLKEDYYQIGFVINDSTGRYYHNSNQVIVKKNGIWSVSAMPVATQKKFVSERKSISVKASNKSIQQFIDTFEYAGETVTVNGWGFLDGLNTNDIEHYILFKKGNDVEIFDTDVQTRTDVTTHFKDSRLNLDSSGFLARVPIEKLQKGLYQVGVYLVKGEKQGAVFSDRYLEVKDDRTVRVITKDEYETSSQKKFISDKKSIPIKESNKSIQQFIDTFEYAGETVTINGWGFLDGLNTDDIKHYLLFKKGNDVEIFDTDVQTRTDVTTHFKDSRLNLDSSGFLARVPIEKLQKGLYQVGVYLVKGEKQGAVFSDRYLEIKDDNTVRVITKDEYEKIVASKAPRELSVTDEKAEH